MASEGLYYLCHCPLALPKVYHPPTGESSIISCNNRVFLTLTKCLIYSSELHTCFYSDRYVNGYELPCTFAKFNYAAAWMSTLMTKNAIRNWTLSTLGHWTNDDLNILLYRTSNISSACMKHGGMTWSNMAPLKAHWKTQAVIWNNSNHLRMSHLEIGSCI